MDEFHSRRQSRDPFADQMLKQSRRMAQDAAVENEPEMTLAKPNRAGGSESRIGVPCGHLTGDLECDVIVEHCFIEEDACQSCPLLGAPIRAAVGGLVENRLH